MGKGTKPDDPKAASYATSSDDSQQDRATTVDELAEALSKTTVRDDAALIPKALREFADLIESGKARNILVVTGAGISVSAGIPDFRSPGTGLYDNLQKYDLPYPEAVFDLDFFANRNPQPFITLAKELWPTGLTFQPTMTHCFLTLLERKNLLLRVYSQNIDGLEHLAELPTQRLVECHGHFRTASCVRCKKAASDMEVIKQTILEKSVVPICEFCKKGYVKPDIVFFGEGLPRRFHDLLPQDLARADCCLVLGTSLQVAPVSLIPSRVPRKCKRILLNRELVGNFGYPDDLYHLADCDESIRSLARRLGWTEELLALHEQVTTQKQTSA